MRGEGESKYRCLTILHSGAFCKGTIYPDARCLVEDAVVWSTLADLLTIHLVWCLCRNDRTVIMQLLQSLSATPRCAVSAMCFSSQQKRGMHLHPSLTHMANEVLHLLHKPPRVVSLSSHTADNRLLPCVIIMCL